MVEETAQYLLTDRAGIYLDLTCGGGGHLIYLSAFLEKEAILIGIDHDPEAVAAARESLRNLPQKTEIVNSRFSALKDALKDLGLGKVTGVLMDLGVSSHQIDNPERGFSFMNDGPLDMRMGPASELTAGEVINDYPVERLKEIFREYGEDRRPGKAANAIIRARQKGPIGTTGQLGQILGPLYPPHIRNGCLARLFQAVRIEVNGELAELATAIPSALEVLQPGGRMVVIAYHSLEDRIVKRAFVAGAKSQPPVIKLLTKKVVKPQETETGQNNRARSARLRAIEKWG